MCVYVLMIVVRDKRQVYHTQLTKKVIYCSHSSLLEQNHNVQST